MNIMDFLYACGPKTVNGRRIRSQWFTFGLVKVYLRAGRIYNADLAVQEYMAIVATVDVIPMYRGVGHFTEFLDWLEWYTCIQEYKEVRVENVLNEKLALHLKKDGYEMLKHSDPQIPTLFKNIQPAYERNLIKD